MRYRRLWLSAPLVIAFPIVDQALNVRQTEGVGAVAVVGHPLAQFLGIERDLRPVDGGAVKAR